MSMETEAYPRFLCLVNLGVLVWLFNVHLFSQETKKTAKLYVFYIFNCKVKLF